MKTSDYSKFKFIKSNRIIQPGLVDRLKKSIKKIGYIESRPILVNKNFEILDGQNRFIACKELGLPIFYSISDNKRSSSEIILELNKNQLVWRLQDYIHHFAQLNVPYHTEMELFENRFHLGSSNTIRICSTSHDGQCIKIKNGVNAPLNPKRYEVAEFILNCNQLPFYKSAHFVAAVSVLFDKVGKNEINKIYAKHLSIPQQPMMNSYLAVFQNILNKHRKEKLSLQ